MSEQNTSTTLKISGKPGKEYVKKVAGAIGWQLREFGFCKFRAAGVLAVHVGIKASAINNRRLHAAGVTLGFEASHSELGLQNKNKKDLTYVTEILIAEVTHARPGAFHEFRISSEGDPENLGRAISSKIKNNYGCRLKCIGAQTVYNAVEGLIRAKGELFENGLRVTTVPYWEVSTGYDDTSVNVLCMDAWSYKEIT